MRHCYFKRSKLSAAKFRQILRLFAIDLTASETARLSGASVRSVNDLYISLRERLAYECERHRPFKGGEVEGEESYFGPRRVRGKRCRGAGGKTIVFGIFKRDGRGYEGLVDVGCEKHLRIHHGRNQFARGRSHINGIESFGATPSVAWRSSTASAATRCTCS